MRMIGLRKLILLLACATAALTFFNGLFASYTSQRDLLIAQTLDSNRVYAAKQAFNTDKFIYSAQAHLAYSAQYLTTRFPESEHLQAEADRLRLQSNDFNSAVVVAAEGLVLATSPQNLGLVGTRPESLAIDAVLGQRNPVITEPLIGATKRFLVVMSHPIINSNGDYLGYVSATIYLKDKNILNAILDEKYREDGGHVYVVDRNGQLIYHPESTRIGERVWDNQAVRQVLEGKEGSLRLTNTRKVNMLTGFAQMKTTGWGVVAQTPTESTLAVLDNLMFQMLLYTAPLSILILLGIWWLSTWIALPLRKLALNAESWEKPEALAQFRKVKAWYYEADQLKFALVMGLSQLQQRLGKLSMESITDPLTGLVNRRGLRLALDGLLLQGRGLSIISVDVDHFKQVNDRHGHDVGDEVLKFIARHIQECFRLDDILCRFGGEEFVVLLPGMDLEAAYKAAERLRISVSSKPCPSGEMITISAGVAYLPAGCQDVKSVLKESDAALYAAKNSSRNCVVSTLHLDANFEGY